MSRTHTHSTTFEDQDVDIEFTMTPIIPAVLWGDCPQPAEGGEIEIVAVILADGDQEVDLLPSLSDEQVEKLTNEIVESGFEPDEGPDDGPDWGDE